MSKQPGTRNPFWTGFWRKTDGTALVEMAFAAPILALVLIGAWDFGGLAKEHSRVTTAATVGSQFGMLFPDDAAAIEQVVRDELGPVGSSATISVNTYCECPGSGASVACGGTCTGFNNPAKFMSIQVQSSFETLFDYPEVSNPVDISRQMTIRIQ